MRLSGPPGASPVTRTSTLAAALVLTATVALSATQGGLADPASASAADKPRHNLKVDAKELDSANRFVLYGKVETYPSGKIVLLRSVAGHPYRSVRKLETTHNGRFRSRIFQVHEALTCFRVVVPATSTYRRTVSKGAACIKSG